MRLIDADALIEKCSWDADTRVGYVQVVDVGDIDNAPTIDPVKHGRWIGEEVDIDGHTWKECGVCHCVCIVDNYCSNCGAKNE